jgi:hypothetical protein
MLLMAVAKGASAVHMPSFSNMRRLPKDKAKARLSW